MHIPPTFHRGRLPVGFIPPTPTLSGKFEAVHTDFQRSIVSFSVNVMKRETERKKSRRGSPDPFLRRGFTPGESGYSGSRGETGNRGARGEGGRMFAISAEMPKCQAAGSREPGAGTVRGAAGGDLAVAPARSWGGGAGGEALRCLPSPPPLSVGYSRCLQRGPKRRSRAPSVPVSGSSLHGQRAPGAPRPPPPPLLLLCNWQPQPLSAWR